MSIRDRKEAASEFAQSVLDTHWLVEREAARQMPRATGNANHPGETSTIVAVSPALVMVEIRARPRTVAVTPEWTATSIPSSVRSGLRPTSRDSAWGIVLVLVVAAIIGAGWEIAHSHDPIGTGITWIIVCGFVAFMIAIDMPSDKEK